MNAMERTCLQLRQRRNNNLCILRGAGRALVPLIRCSGTAVIILVLMVALIPGAAWALQPGDLAPAFAAQDVSGRNVRSADLAGKVVLVAFWATWCRTCREELPGLDRLLGKYGNRGFSVVAVTVGSSRQAVADYLKSNTLSFPVLLDDGTVSALYQCVHLPTAFLIGRDGVIRKVYKGAAKDALAVYEKEIKELIDKQ